MEREFTATETFEHAGRYPVLQWLFMHKLGILLSDGVAAELLTEVEAAASKMKASVERVAPQIGGVKSNDGAWIEVQQRIDGGPSVLYDAVFLMLTKESAITLCSNAAAVDFVSDAYAHCKYIGFVAGALPLLQRCHVPAEDEGVIEIGNARDIKSFLQSCGALRVWPREAKVFAEPSHRHSQSSRPKRS